MPNPSNTQASLESWLDYLLAVHPVEIEMGLARVTQVAKRLDVTDFGTTKVVTVAGTNGKGTTCAMVESMLSLSGKTVAVYSSPHLIAFNERFRIAGKDAEDGQIIAAFEAIEAARGEISLTFFEFATLTALLLFKAANVDVILLEVGLGGRLDATNIIDADICVVTAIDLDHQEYLGDTRELVAREKAGIFRPQTPAIIGEPDRPATLVDFGRSIGANLFCVNEAFHYQVQGEQWHYQSQQLFIDNIALPQLPLPNAATAIAVVEHLYDAVFSEPMPIENIKLAIANTRLNGRLERVNDTPLIMLDVAHNPHAASYLAEQLNGFNAPRILALCGMLNDKDSACVIEVLAPSVDRWYFSSLDVPRGAQGQDLLSKLPSDHHGAAYDSISHAWAALKAEIKSDDVVIVFGSFYTVAGFKHLMEGTHLV